MRFATVVTEEEVKSEETAKPAESEPEAKPSPEVAADSANVELKIEESEDKPSAEAEKQDGN